MSIEEEAPAPRPTPITPPAKSQDRTYLVAKEVKAGTLPSDTLVWFELPEEKAAEPDVAMDLAARHEDERGEWDAGTRYLAANRYKTKVPVKDVTPRWS